MEIQWLIVREIPNLRRFARALLRDGDAADDLVQDCLERALRKHHLWLRRGSMRAWLLRMLYNLYLNGATRRRRIRSSASLHECEEQQASPASQEACHHLRDTIAALELLPEPQREAILLMALQDLSYDEAAWVLGVPVGTVRSRLSRGREALREMVAGARRPVAPLRRIK
jgi:RNA polymerase sigma-70 factor (ECF subfamily)